MKTNLVGYFLVFSVFVLNLSSCLSDDILSVDVEKGTIKEVNTKVVSIEEVSKLAQMVTPSFLDLTKFGELEALDTKSTSSSINTIESEGNPVAYYINYPQNKGFMIISASKMSTPIIAFSDSGSFIPSALDEASQQWLEELKENILAEKSTSVDTANINYKFWETIQCEEDEVVSFELVNNVVSTKSWDNREEALNRQMIFPLCYPATWGGEFGYNYYLEKCTNKGGVLVSSVVPTITVALAHIMYAHWHPGRYGWMYMPSTIENVPLNHKENLVGALMRDISNDLNIRYTSHVGATIYSRSMPNIPSLLQSRYEYSNGGSIIDYSSDESSFLSVYNSLRAGSPVLIYSHRNPGAYDEPVNGWVADGYQEVKMKATKKKYFMGILVKTTVYYYYTDFFHLLYSFNGGNNGWYVYNDGNTGIGVKKAVVNIRP